MVVVRYVFDWVSWLCLYVYFFVLVVFWERVIVGGEDLSGGKGLKVL